MIAVIDYGMGNVGSIINMFHKIHEDVLLASDPESIESADKLILPGVGSFDNGMSKLSELGLTDSIKKHASKGKLLLGICLGMQLLGKSSEEGKLEGLSLVDFHCNRFSFRNDIGLKVPHMGWNIVSIKSNDEILSGIEGTPRYYFVHSYHAVCTGDKDILMSSTYGYEFTAAVKHGNVYGMQFHPEKSHNFGMKLLQNFARL